MTGSVAVIGSGMMGSAIAAMSALAGNCDCATYLTKPG